jgi:hypothetical protein
LVKNVRVENQYLEHIRDVHDPSMHLKTIEDELKGTIGKALGKQGEKILMYTRLMHQERQIYEDLLEQKYNANSEQQEKRIDAQLLKHAQQHNLYRKDCLHARWELIVHRQAVGFIVGNHKYVTEKFPVAEALPEGDGDNTDGDTSDTAGGSDKETAKKVFGDQLDWWQRIGRWR